MHSNEEMVEQEMHSNEEMVEQEIKKKGLNAPRLNPASINDAILAEQYYLFPGTVVTVCCLTLQNGFSVVGHSAPVSPDNFDKELGKKIAKTKAMDKIWKLEVYLLRDKISSGRATT